MLTKLYWVSGYEWLVVMVTDDNLYNGYEKRKVKSRIQGKLVKTS